MIQQFYESSPSTNLIAVGAVVSPVWLPWLQSVSDLAGLLLPIAGLIWLVMQMYFFVQRNKK